MNLKKQVVGLVASIAILTSMTGGIASAQTDSDTEATNLNVTCPAVATVDAQVGGDFILDLTSDPLLNDTNVVDFTVVTDLRCNWSDDFQVDASITQFNYGGVLPSPDYAAAFSGAHLRWTGGALDSYVGVNYSSPGIEFLFGVPWAGEPDVASDAFVGFQTTTPGIIENDSVFFITAASPGISTASWDGQLRDLPPNLADGIYTADLTVTLTVN